jgi:hypothetical protein
MAIARDEAHLAAIAALESATNDRLLAERQRLPGIGVEELVWAVPHAGVVNASFCHAHPLGARFSGPERGAWYAAFDVATSQALAAALLDEGALGVIYPSVRHEGGTCLSCFRPALVANVRRANTYRFTWRGSPVPVVVEERVAITQRAARTKGRR